VPGDNDTDPGIGISRFPDGRDAGNNLDDFVVARVTPGAANDLVAHDTVPTNWGNLLNQLDWVAVTWSADTLYLHLQARCEDSPNTNAIVGYLDIDYGAATGIHQWSELVDLDGGVQDTALKVHWDATFDSGFGAEFAFGTVGLRMPDAQWDPDAGWRRIHATTSPTSFDWYDTNIARMRLLGGPDQVRAVIPLSILGVSAGDRLGLFVRLVDADDPTGFSNQCLPQDDALLPAQVHTVLAFTL
jgi:hypothetical protein